MISDEMPSSHWPMVVCTDLMHYMNMMCSNAVLHGHFNVIHPMFISSHNWNMLIARSEPPRVRMIRRSIVLQNRDYYKLVVEGQKDARISCRTGSVSDLASHSEISWAHASPINALASESSTLRTTNGNGAPRK